MLTCEAIGERAHQISAVIDRTNCRAVANAIYPPVGPIERLYEKDDNGPEYSLPEWHEYCRPRSQTVDWADIVVSIVLSRQWRSALLAHGLCAARDRRHSNERP